MFNIENNSPEIKLYLQDLTEKHIFIIHLIIYSIHSFMDGNYCTSKIRMGNPFQHSTITWNIRTG